MTRIRASLYMFCLGKASEARRKAEVADTCRDYEHWSTMKLNGTVWPIFIVTASRSLHRKSRPQSQDGSTLDSARCFAVTAPWKRAR